MKFKLEEILKGIGTTILAGALAFAIAGSAYAYKSASSKEKTRIKKEALLLAEKQEKEKTENFNKDLDNFNKRFFRIVENGEIGNSLERFQNIKKEYNAETNPVNPLYLKTKDAVIECAKKVNELRQLYLKSNGEIDSPKFYSECNQLAQNYVKMVSEPETQVAKTEIIVAKANVVEKKEAKIIQPSKEIKLAKADATVIVKKIVPAQIKKKSVKLIVRLPEKKVESYDAATLKNLEKAYPYFKTACQKTKLPDHLFDEYVGLGWTESWFEVGAKGSAGERGYHQVMPSTYALYYKNEKLRNKYELVPWYHIENFPRDSESMKSLEIVAALHFSSRIKKNKKHSDAREIILRYNWGNGRVDRAVSQFGNFENLWSHLKKKETDKDKKAYYYVIYTLRYKEKCEDKIKELEKTSIGL
ncbi:hypothetical protein COS75_02565 [Candidatus Pacearchaeota archaeon CG06_land_8_20_14_3_00_35_12]|nr:MAG: hypothetical protein COS75_02565 [Candidatus Pacearchaeota archaeon CG06_land_8_20_14_3_00_35_12]